MSITPNYNLLSFWVISGLFLLTCSFGISASYANESGVDTLLIAPEQRAIIDQQRLNFLNSKDIGEIEEEKKPEVKLIKKSAPYKPRNPIASKIAVSAVIEKPNGERVVRVNNEFYSETTPKVPLQLNQATPKGAVVVDGGKTVLIPIGSTYLSNKQTVVESHTLDKKRVSSQPARQILNADDSAIKQTLKDVQTINVPQK